MDFLLSMAILPTALLVFSKRKGITCERVYPPLQGKKRVKEEKTGREKEREQVRRRK